MIHRDLALRFGGPFLAIALAACATAGQSLDLNRDNDIDRPPPTSEHGQAMKQDDDHVQDTPTPEPLFDARSFPTFDGRTGDPVHWETLVRIASEADVVLLGEMHGHTRALAAMAALFEDVAARRPGTVALSMEFFERDQQANLDDYLLGVTDEARFKSATRRTEKNYPAGHRAMVETARETGRPVIAANVPRRYARLARTEGYDRLKALTPEQQRLFVVPEKLSEGPYWERFLARMTEVLAHTPSADTGQSSPPDGSAEEAKSPEGASAPAGSAGAHGESNTSRSDHAVARSEQDGDAAGPGVAGGENGSEKEPGAKGEATPNPEESEEQGPPALSEEMVRSFFRAQNLWDATMADSVAAAFARGYRPVFHVVGQFHIDFDGGLPSRIRELAPGAKIVTISYVDRCSTELDGEDKERADVIVYVGEPEENPGE